MSNKYKSSITEVKFPNVNLTLSLNAIIRYNYDDLYKLLKTIKYYELGGDVILDISPPEISFTIEPKASHWDEKNRRPYTILNSKSKIVWHSHPFNTSNPVNYPSNYDLFIVLKHPNLISLIVCDKGIYVISSVVNQKSIDENIKDVDIIYKSIKNTDILENLFISNEISKKLLAFGLNINFIPCDNINKDFYKYIKNLLSYA